jgi:hypothetical protein
MGSLLKLITKLFGKNALGKTLGTRTNVIKLPNNEKKRLIKNELDIERASDAAAQKVLEEAKELIPDLPKMNDMERLVFEGNLRRLDNRLNPPSAEVVEFGTKKPMSEAGIKQLAAEKGFPEGVDPESTMGRLLTSTRKLQDEAEKLKTQTPSQQFEDLLKNPYRSGGPLDPKSGIVRTAARQILRKKLDEGQIDIPDAAERDAIAKGYQGGVDPIEVFRKRFGEDPLQDLDEIADELNRARDFKEIDNILKRNKLFDIEPKKDYGYQEGSYTDEEMAALLKKSEEDPEGFAKGGKVEKGSPKIFDQLEMDVPHPYGHRTKFQQGGNFQQFLQNRTNEVMQTGMLGNVISPVVEQMKRMQSIKPMDRSYATRAQDIARPYVDMATKAGYGNVPGQIQGIGSDVRHTVGASMGKDSVIDFISQFGVKPEGRFADFIGNAAIFGSTAAQELQDAYGSLKRGEGLAQPFEDVKANFAAMNLPYGSSEQEKLDYAIAQSPSKSMIDTTPSDVIPNFEKLSDGSYRDTRSGDIYGSETYGSIAAGMYPDIYNPNQQTTNSNIQNLTQLMDDVNQTSGTTTIRSLEEAKNYLKQQGLAAPSNQESIITDGPYKFKVGTDGSITYLGLIEGYATGGRVGFSLGSLPKGIQALAKQLNKKFGKGTIKTADEMERPKSVKEKEMFEEFEARNPDPKRKLTDDEIKDYEEELGDSETWMSEGTVEEAEQALKRQKEYEAAMYTDYKAGRLDPQPGEKGRKEFLEKKLEEMEMSGDKKIMSVDEIEELSNMDLEAEMNVAKSLAPKMVERFELKQKYPGITDELLDKILIDDNMQRKAEVLATIDEAFKMLEKGMGHDEVLDTLKNVTRTKQAGGGLAYLMGL